MPVLAPKVSSYMPSVDILKLEFVPGAAVTEKSLKMYTPSFAVTTVVPPREIFAFPSSVALEKVSVLTTCPY